jgi:hypothetical protein
MALLDGHGRARPAALIVAAALGCEVHGFIGSNATLGSGDDASAETTSVGTGDDDDGTTLGSADESADDDHHEDESDGEDTSDVRFDLGQPDAPPGCDVPPPFPSCDTHDDDPFHALGMNCADTNGPQVSGQFTGHEDAIAVHTGQLGAHEAFAPREGEKFVVLSTGRAGDLTLSPEELADEYPGRCSTVVNGAPSNAACPSTTLMDLDGVPPDDSPMYMLPEPLDVRRVSDIDDCWEDPNLVGTGDCSNTLWDPWLKGGKAFDYAELRMNTQVPEGMNGFAFDFAFFSIEYPLYQEHEAPFNDMFVAWLDSERWTGNVSFDEEGSPISVTSVLFNYKDATSEQCPGPCNAPQLGGFAAENHGGTKWLTSTAPVRPGEDVTVVFAIFDNADATFDSMVILDHFEWTCSGAPPFTTPAG